MSPVRVLATAGRVLLQLRHDHRTVAMVLLIPLVLMTLLRYMFGDGHSPAFDHVAPSLLALFPFVLMFVITSVAMLRERAGGTLERLLTMPIAKVDILLGYGLAFGAAAIIQVALVTALVLGPLGLHINGSVPVLVLVAVVDALLGTALGLCLSALAGTEFQAVQLLPAVVFPQALLCGLFTPREQMAIGLRWLSDVLPLSYAVDGVSRTAAGTGWSGGLVVDLAVVIACVPAALGVGALTLRRQTP